MMINVISLVTIISITIKFVNSKLSEIIVRLKNGSLLGDREIVYEIYFQVF